MKKIMLVLIAILAICTLVAEINNVTFSSQAGSNRNYLVYGNVRRTTIPPATEPASGVWVNVTFTGADVPSLSPSINNATDQNGFYYVDARDYAIPAGYSHVTVSVENFFYQTFEWNYAPLRVDILIDQGM